MNYLDKAAASEAAASDDEIRTFGNGDGCVETLALTFGGAVILGIGLFLLNTHILAEKMNISYSDAGRHILDLFR